MRTLKENLLRNVGVDGIRLIENWLKENVIFEKSYTIDSKFEINACGSVTLKSLIQEIPDYIQFGAVDGYFRCANNRNLVSLRGCPRECCRFSCTKCTKLKNLIGGPIRTKSNYDCTYCKGLTTLEGGPKEVGGEFDCSNCHNLKSLKGGPRKVTDIFRCMNNKKIENLEGISFYVGIGVDLSNCNRGFTKSDVRKRCKYVLYVYA